MGLSDLTERVVIATGSSKQMKSFDVVISLSLVPSGFIFTMTAYFAKTGQQFR
jgi:hypothetical protein